MSDGIDRAKTLLEPFRFNFHRVVAGMSICHDGAGIEIEEAISDLLKGHARGLFPSKGPITVSIERGHQHRFGNDFSFGNYRYSEAYDTAEAYSENVHLSLLKTVASYAGQSLGFPHEIPEAFKNFFPSDPASDSPDLDTSPHDRWYLHLLSRGYFTRFEADIPSVLCVYVCDDAFGATWNLLNELQAPRASNPRLEVFDGEEKQIIDLIGQVGHRLTTKQLLAEFERRGNLKAESTTKAKLGRMVKAGLLSNRHDVSPHKGYGLPDWD